MSQTDSRAAAADAGAVAFGVAVHCCALLAFHVIRPQQSRMPAGCTWSCAQVLWTTWQANALSLVYYSVSLASTRRHSSDLERLVAGAYPLVFSLGMCVRHHRLASK